MSTSVKRLFSDLETPFSRVLLTAGKQIPCVKDTEMWFGEYHFNWQSSQPTPQFGVLTTLSYGISLFLDQVRRTLEILGAQRVLYRLIGEPVLLVPLTGPGM
jgi:hypothetical protein